MTNNQTPATIIAASEDLTVVMDGFDTDAREIGFGDLNADVVHPMTVTRDFTIRVTETDEAFHTELVHVGTGMTCALPKPCAVTFVAALPYRDREAIARGIAALVVA